MLRRLTISLLSFTLIINIVTITYGKVLGNSSIGDWYHPYVCHIDSLCNIDELLLDKDISDTISKRQFIDLVIRAVGLGNTATINIANRYDLYMYHWNLDSELSRAEAAYILDMTLKNMYGVNLECKPRTALYFKDYINIKSSTYFDSIINMIEIGVFKGSPGGEFETSRGITLAESIVAISRTITEFYIDDTYVYVASMGTHEPYEDGTIFSTADILEVLNGEIDREIHLNELKSIMYDAFGKMWFDIYQEYDRAATIEDTLDMIYQLSGCKLIKLAGDEKYLYPAGDSSWLSNKEWTALIRNLDKNIMLSSALILADRTSEYMRVAKQSKIPKDYNTFVNVCNQILPEYKILVDEGKDAIHYWVTGRFEEGVVIKYEDDFESILHETQHELSAIKSDIFVGREVEPETGSWQVILGENAVCHYYYNSMAETWIGISTPSEYTKTQSLCEDIPYYIKESNQYVTYINSDTSASNKWGIYGILMELCSYNINLRSKVVLDSFGARKSGISNEAYNYYFWRGMLLHYVTELEQIDIVKYNEVISNIELVKLIVDSIEFGDRQVGYENFLDFNNYSLCTMYEWATSDTFECKFEQLREIAYMSYIA